MKLLSTLALALLSSSVPRFVAADTDSPICNNKLIKGSYAFTLEGQIQLPNQSGPSPEIGVVVQTFDGQSNGSDGQGALTVIVTAVVGGGVSADGATGTGTYKVYSDCTGTFTQNVNGKTIIASFVIAQNGNEIYTVVISPTGFTVRTLGKRQFVLPEKDSRHGERSDEG